MGNKWWKYKEAYNQNYWEDDDNERCKVVVCGLIGSEKSSLLSTILGEIPRISKEGVTVNGRKAYVPQSAWIQIGTFREN